MYTSRGQGKVLKTRKGNIMKNTITYAVALNTAIEALKESNPAIADRLACLRDTLARRSSSKSDTAREKAAAKRKEQTAMKRAEMVSEVIPILRDVITTDMTAKEIFTAACDRLPQDFSAAKVQNILLREMKDELVKTETKGKANTYRLA